MKRWIAAVGAAVLMASGVVAATPAAADTETIDCTAQAAKAWPPAVSRIQGADRYATAVQISKTFSPGVAELWVANGTSFADGLTAGAGQAHKYPTLLVQQDAIPAVVRTEITRLAPARIVVVGGEGVVSAAVYQQLGGLAPAIERIAGADRYETSRNAALRDLAAKGNSRIGSLAIATGRNFPDALAVSAVYGSGTNLLLVDGFAKALSSETTHFLDAVRPTNITIVGGTGAVSPNVEASVRFFSPESTITRVAGNDRYGTSEALVNATPMRTIKTQNQCAGAILVTGATFPDALTAGALSTGPFWVVPPTCVPQTVLDKARTLRVEKVTLIGGTGALSKTVESLTSCSSLPKPTATAAPGSSTNCTVPAEFVGASKASGPLSCAEYQQVKAIAAQLVAPLRGQDRLTQIQGVWAALQADYRQVAYSDKDPHYADPYGFFVLHRASCAGITRAAGLLLTELGIPWTHANKNGWTHQWAIVTINGVKYEVDPAWHEPGTSSETLEQLIGIK